MVKRVPGPDRLEQGLRLGCGALFGLFVVGFALLRIALRVGAPWLAYVGIPVSVAVFAYLGRRWGDDLYHRWADGELFGDDTYWLWALLLAFVGIVIWLSLGASARTG